MVADNLLEEISDDIFENMGVLEEVDVSGNKIKQFPQAFQTLFEK